jgi:hypothetical protein
MSESPPETLFHYTSQQGLLGMLQGRELWATKVYYLNDGREIAHGFDVARAYLEGRPHFKDEGESGLLLRTLHDYIDRVSLMNVCVASFTELGDQLSQWRGYGRPGDSYSIGFPGAYLQENWRREMWVLSRCLYDYDEQVAAVGEVVQRAVERFQFLLEPGRMTETDPGKIMGAAAESAGFEYIFALLRVAAAIKDPSFAEEREWRLISGRLDRPKMSFRAGKHTLIPYHRLALRDLEGQDLRVLVGATQHPTLAMGAVLEVMQHEGLRYSSLDHSKVSFRDW